MRDLILRIIKTFVQVLLGTLIPKIAAWFAGWENVNWGEWKVWLLPVVCASIAAAITAAWNMYKLNSGSLMLHTALPDWADRSIKTFIEAFLGIFIPSLVQMLNDITRFSWGAWNTWKPLVGAAIAAGISAAWNGLSAANRSEVS